MGTGERGRAEAGSAAGSEGGGEKCFPPGEPVHPRGPLPPGKLRAVSQLRRGRGLEREKGEPPSGDQSDCTTDLEKTWSRRSYIIQGAGEGRSE